MGYNSKYNGNEVDNLLDKANTALQEHQDISGKANIADLAKVATSGSYNDLSNKPTIPSAITVDSSLSSTSTNPVQNKVINSALSGKLSTSGTAAAATKLANKRTIWGQEFDGTGNITGDMTVTGHIIPSGNVRIANAKGIAGANSAGTYYMVFTPRSASNMTEITYGTGGFLIKNEAAKQVININTNTHVGIRTTPSSNHNVNISGSVYMDGVVTMASNLTVNGTFTNPSSAVLKDIIDRDGLTLEQLSKIKPTRFTWKDGRDKDVHLGGIADEVKEVMPEVIHEQEDGTYTMEYANAAFAMVSSLVKYVEQNQQRIAELEKEIAELKNRL